MPNRLSLICPECSNTLVLASVVIDTQLLTVWICDCVPQAVAKDDIQQARKVGGTLVYTVEISDGSEPIATGD